MLNRICATLALLVVTSAVVAQEHTNTNSDSVGVRLAPANGGFTAIMPAKPEEQLTTKEGVTTHVYIAKLDRSVYLAAYTDYAFTVEDPQKELEADRDNFNKVLEAKLLTTRNITFDGRQGIEFTSETAAANIKSRVFIRGNRIFQQAVLIGKDTDQAKAVETFFNSFAFTTKN